MRNKLLPIGSIIRTKEKPEIDLMICAYFEKNAIVNNNHFDYACCLYPMGMGKKAILVKKEDIFEIKFIGYQTGLFDEFRKKYEGEN